MFFFSYVVKQKLKVNPCELELSYRHVYRYPLDGTIYEFFFFSRARRTTFPSTHFLLQPYLLLQPTRRISAKTQQHAAVPEDFGEPCCSRPARTHRRSEGKRVHKATQGKYRRCCKSAVLDKLT